MLAGGRVDDDSPVLPGTLNRDCSKIIIFADFRQPLSTIF